MAKPFTATIGASGCSNPDCDCGTLVITFRDVDGNLLHGIALPRPVAEAFRAQVDEVLDGPSGSPERRLASIRCEGSA